MPKARNADGCVQRGTFELFIFAGLHVGGNGEGAGPQVGPQDEGEQTDVERVLAGGHGNLRWSSRP